MMHITARDGIIHHATIESKSSMKIKSMRSLALLVATGTLAIASSPLRASETDDRIESSAKKSYVFKTYLKNDSVKTESKDGVVALAGTVAETFHKVLARTPLKDCPESTAWTIRSVSKATAPSKTRTLGWS